MHKEVVDFLNNKVTDCAAVFNEAALGDHSITVAATSVKNVCLALKDGDFEFNVLQVITATDWLEAEEIELSYILASFTKNLEVIIKIRVPRGTTDNLPKVDSICDLWKAANFLERECFDMLGIEFVGHPDPRRILCPDDWEGYPLRKDYVVQEKYKHYTVNPPDKINKADIEFFAKTRLEHKNPASIIGSWKDDHDWIDQELTASAKTHVADFKAKAKEAAAAAKDGE